VDSGKAKDIIVGTTTNGTIYDQKVEKLIKEFKEFHLGISIETVTSLNDYIRYPGKIKNILENLDKFLALRSNSGLYVSLRITPNVFTISEYDLLVDYMMEKQVIAESCNILHSPACLTMEIMPQELRLEIIEKLNHKISQYKLESSGVINIRNQNLIASVISDNVIEYKNFLENYKVPENVEQHRRQLVNFLKTFEVIRKNSIIDYAPKYENFLRSYGY
jgi:sulfatase maturation enzyme AslB (radical SAM superfamily)